MEYTYMFLSFSIIGIANAQTAELNTTCSKVTPLMTSSSGAPVDDMISSLSAGIVGPLVLQDLNLIEELSHFNRERIPERVVHAKGSGAFGYFTVTDTSFTKFCKASLFESLVKNTSVVVRFSTLEQESGSCETVRGIRGAAIKFYTDDGIFDLVGCSSPIYFIRDPILYPSLIHAMKRHPATNVFDPDTFWDFMTLRPETTHQLLFMFSDRGTPDGYRHMNIYGGHTFKIVNKEGKAFYCKLNFRADQGVKSLNATSSQDLCASDPDYATKDLYKTIAEGKPVSWTLYYQVMTFQQAIKFRWNPFDITKIWPIAEFPYHEIGKLILNSNPTNHFVDVEQAAFSPSNLVPGIEPSPDKLLQGRLFAYPDAQRYRLGVNYNQLPVNSPRRVTVRNNHRDGQMCLGANQGDSPNYYPCSSRAGLKVCPEAANANWPLTGDVKRYNTDNQDNYGQVKIFWERLLNEPQRQRLVTNLAEHLKKANTNLQERALENFKNVALEFTQRVAAAIIGLTLT